MLEVLLAFVQANPSAFSSRPTWRIFISSSQSNSELFLQNLSWPPKDTLTTLSFPSSLLSPHHQLQGHCDYFILGTCAPRDCWGGGGQGLCLTHPPFSQSEKGP